MNLLKIKIAHRSCKVRMNFGKLKEARTKVFSKVLIKKLHGYQCTIPHLDKIKTIKMQAEKDGLTEIHVKKIS